MEDLDGIETAKLIRNMTKQAYLVFVTAFLSYSLEGYKVDAIRYPIKDNDCLVNNDIDIEKIQQIIYSDIKL